MENLYNKFYEGKPKELHDLWKVLMHSFDINKVLYPGSNAHLTPSFYFREVVYVDTDDSVRLFFKEKELIKRIIDMNLKFKKNETLKTKQNEFRFHNLDYNYGVNEEMFSFDLLVSINAGLVVDSNLHYLKEGGLVIVDHESKDAFNCYCRPELKLIGVFNKLTKLHQSKLDSYLLPAGDVNGAMHAFLDNDKKKTTPSKYVKQAKYYLFKKIG